MDWQSQPRLRGGIAMRAIVLRLDLLVMMHRTAPFEFLKLYQKISSGGDTAGRAFLSEKDRFLAVSNGAGAALLEQSRLRSDQS